MNNLVEDYKKSTGSALHFEETPVSLRMTLSKRDLYELDHMNKYR